MTTYKPTNLVRWTMPRDYFGAEWPEYYRSGFGQSRDSDALERSNFVVVTRELEKVSEPADWPHEEAPWEIVRENHWLVGWVEWIAIHQDAQQHLEVADRLRAKIANYPILDEQLWSQFEEEDNPTEEEN